MEFHSHILKAQHYLLSAGDAKANTMNLLVSPKRKDLIPELISMWKAIEKRSDTYDDLWVHVFLENVHSASTFPEYFYMSQKERNELCKKIDLHTSQLIKLHKRYNLDIHMIHSNGKIFNGFYIYEDFSNPNQHRINEQNTEKVKYTEILQAIADRSKEEISIAKSSGKSGRNVKAVRFVRFLAQANNSAYKQPLNAVIATAANAIFKTQYTSSDVRNLLAR